ncbi:MAG: hypothetical protein ACKOV8_13070, partial [Phycisphaerales bacterium]
MRTTILAVMAVAAASTTALGQSVRAWGENFYGQCNVPADLGPCIAVAGRGGHTVALRTDGLVRAWGDNVDFQCNVPADLGPSTAVRAWGRNNYGQCNVPANLGPCTAVAAGGLHT